MSIVPEDITNKMFTPSARFKAGYDFDDVDETLDAIANYMRLVEEGQTKEPADSLFFTTNFKMTRFREGYSIKEVDDFMLEVQEVLRGINEKQAESSGE